MTEAITPCGSTLYEGAVPAEVTGVESWGFKEDLKSSEYADNTTACGTKDTKANITGTVDVAIHLQDGAAYAKPPWRVGDNRSVQLHVNDTGSDYYEGVIRVMGMEGNEFNHSSSDPVKVTYSCKVQGVLVGNGTLADA